MLDVAIIGAGIVGCFTARALSRYDLEVVLLEKDNDVSNHTSKANSGIIHAGYDSKPGTNKAKFNVLGNPMFDTLAQELDFAFKRNGSLVVAFSKDELSTLEELYERGKTNGVLGLRIVGKKELRELEPNLSDEAEGALLAETGGVIDPWEAAIAAAENAIDNGVTLELNSEVTEIERLPSGYRLRAGDKEIDAKYVVNCAGTHADTINNMVASPAFEIKPRRGQYHVLDKSAGNFFTRTIFQCPTKAGKGVLVVPTVHGNLLVGPDAEEIGDKDDTETSLERLSFVKKAAKKTSANIPFWETIREFAGVRAGSDVGDFVIGESKEAKGFINVAAIESPGLTAAPAIAEHVCNVIEELDGAFRPKNNWSPIRRKAVRFMQLSDGEKVALIKKDARYGRVICRCEKITEGEIVDVIKRSAGATNIDAIKRRARPGMGRCQGGFCEPLILKLLAEELDMDLMEIVKDNQKSKLLFGRTKNNENYIKR